MKSQNPIRRSRRRRKRRERRRMRRCRRRRTMRRRRTRNNEIEEDFIRGKGTEFEFSQRLRHDTNHCESTT